MTDDDEAFIYTFAKIFRDYTRRSYRECGVAQLADGDAETYAISANPDATKRAHAMVEFACDFAVDMLCAVTGQPRDGDVATNLKSTARAILDDEEAMRKCDFCRSHKRLGANEYVTATCDACGQRGLDMCNDCCFTESDRIIVVCPPHLNLTPCNSTTAGELAALRAENRHTDDEAEKANVGGDK